jgi:hypothetical protein
MGELLRMEMGCDEGMPYEMSKYKNIRETHLRHF